MVDVTIFGASGDLGKSLAVCAAASNLEIAQFSRKKEGSILPYSDFKPQLISRNYIFSTGFFLKKRFVDYTQTELQEILYANFSFPVHLAQLILAHQDIKQIKNLVFIGSTSSYSGFEFTAPYCAAKFALRGFVLAMNEEYKQSDLRFTLVSMGTMASKMGDMLIEQDKATFLQTKDVANRIISIISNNSNSFEPEVVIRRRHIK